MKEIVIISGKGGTGKTSVTASFACLGKNDVVVADCDVDAANMHLLLDPVSDCEEDFSSGKSASISLEKCIQCSECKAVCRFNAIDVSHGIYKVNALACEGCGYCYRVCPASAISMKNCVIGKFLSGKTRTNNILVHAKLNIGADNSGKLVSKIKEESRTIASENEVPLILVDASPGVGCPVIASITGADYIVLVTEPSQSGFHDLQRVFELITQFGSRAGCIINKADLNVEINQKIKEYLDTNKIELLAELPYSNVFTDAIIHAKTIIEYENGEVSNILKECWAKILDIVLRHDNKVR